MSKAEGSGISLFPDQWERVDRRVAKFKLRNRSHYFQLLVEQDWATAPGLQMHSDNSLHLYPEDIKRAVAEDPPDNSKRHRGDGPRRAVS